MTYYIVPLHQAITTTCGKCGFKRKCERAAVIMTNGNQPRPQSTSPICRECQPEGVQDSSQLYSD